ncbi:hypothetical protein K2173_023344 [Erythroxylum novogranatense]|uniref:Uncharacterized protein n=1 Tax=Erythroxylum novogranatense TaxID=1862640 RepID=A0AAV8TY89_9ROSI|nr:hypothetical protein K2173_023344 [Erythroxylum novogranatense]
MHVPRLPSAATPRPPRPPSVAQADAPALEKLLVDQLSQEEQDSLNSKFQEASQAHKKLEKEMLDSRQKVECYRTKMQELILYKSRCDNQLNEVTAWVAGDRREVDALERKYIEKYKQSGDVASRLTIEETTFHDIQERKMELYNAIVKIEEGGTVADVLKERGEHIQLSMEELVKSLSSFFSSADWDEYWDKFEDERYTFIEELTLDVQNVVAPPKQKSSLVGKAISSTKGDAKESHLNVDLNSWEVPSSGKLNSKKKSTHYQNQNDMVGSPQYLATKSQKKSKILHLERVLVRKIHLILNIPEVLMTLVGVHLNQIMIKNQLSNSYLSRFDSIRSTRESDQTYNFPSRFDSFRESRDSEQIPSFSRLDSYRDSAQNHGFSRFDPFRDSYPGQGFPQSFDSFGESQDSDHSQGFSRFNSFNNHESESSQFGNSMARFDSFRVKLQRRIIIAGEHFSQGMDIYTTWFLLYSLLRFVPIGLAT